MLRRGESVVRGVPTFQSTPSAEWTHVLRGVHSKLPICCIAWFVRVYWPRWARATDADVRWARRHCRKMPMVEYVPCPRCVREGHFVEIHMCTKRCAGQPGSVAGSRSPVRQASRVRRPGWRKRPS